MARGQPLGGGAEKTSSEPPHGGKAQTLQNVEVGGLGGASDDVTLRFQFHHIQAYVDTLFPMEHYKGIEKALNDLAHEGHYDPFSGGMRYLPPNAHRDRVQDGARVWQRLRGDAANTSAAYSPAGQDFVEQLILGLGWRVTAEYNGTKTRTVLVTSPDACGVKYAVTCKVSTREETNQEEDEEEENEEPYDHFAASHVERFYLAHSGREGIAVLGFEVCEGGCQDVLAKYKAKHPSLLVSGHVHEYVDTRRIQSRQGGQQKEVLLGSIRIVEVFAFYRDGVPDTGTVLRFVERSGSYAERPGFANPGGVLPGLEDVHASFDGTSIPAYSDHWVSNVLNREDFLSTLEETLGFTPKVDFNAGVISAGDAVIESTVIGNTSKSIIKDREQALRDQTQVYLPVNNALSAHGHVHGFVQQLGQGIQHVASRVDDLVSFVERVNNYRAMTGGGFSFLDIPRSYYGVLTPEDLTLAGCSEALSGEVWRGLIALNISTVTGVIDMDVTADTIMSLSVSPEIRGEWQAISGRVAEVVKRSRYRNIESLLGNRLSSDKYMQIVRNKILIDVQGGDILLQIFTCKILHRDAQQEAPFLEFIQRVCGTCAAAPDGSCAPFKAGCGGFGIRNFLTLFLSIEVSKAMTDVALAASRGDTDAEMAAGARIKLLTLQMNESNPILTEISDAMTDEGIAVEKLAQGSGNACALEDGLIDARRRKKEATHRLQALSDEFSAKMQSLNSRGDQVSSQAA